MNRAPRFAREPTDGDRPPSHGFVPLDQLLATAARDPDALDPALVRSTILGEHRKIRRRLARLEAGAHALLSCSLPKSQERYALRQLALSLCAEMQAHVAFENEVLVPVIERVDSWGPVRAQKLVAEHAQQLALLHAYADMLSNQEGSAQTLAVAVWELVQNVREDMREEEAEALNPALLLDLCDSPVETG